MWLLRMPSFLPMLGIPVVLVTVPAGPGGAAPGETRDNVSAERVLPGRGEEPWKPRSFPAAGLPPCSEAQPFARGFNIETEPSRRPTQVNAVALDPMDNVLLAGQLGGRLDLGLDGGRLSPEGAPDALVVKLDPCGKILWAKAFGDAAEQGVTDVATDAAGNVVVVGYFDSAIDFGAGPLAMRGRYGDVFVTKLDRDGRVLWVKQIFAEEDGQVFGVSIAVDSAGNALLLGALEGTANLGDRVVGPGWETNFVAKLDPEGHTLWSTMLGTNPDEVPSEIEVDSADNAFVAGAVGGGRALLAFALSPGGKICWSKVFRRLGAPQEEYFIDMDVSRAGTLLLAGEGYLGRPSEPNVVGPHFIAEVEASGEIRWYTPRSEVVARIAATPLGSTFVAGTSGHCRVATPLAEDCIDLLLAELDSSGVEQRLQRFAGAAEVTALEADAQGRAVIAGRFTGTLDLEPRPLTTPGIALFVARIPR
jgi:hypothetical protein